MAHLNGLKTLLQLLYGEPIAAPTLAAHLRSSINHVYYSISSRVFRLFLAPIELFPLFFFFFFPDVIRAIVIILGESD